MIPRMRLREYRTNTQQEGGRRGGGRSTARADETFASQAPPMLFGALPLNSNPRILFEDFDGDRFITDPVEPYVNQAIDIIEAFDKAW